MSDCLTGKNVHDHMSKLIDQYFIKHLSLSQEDAYKLHQEYYKSYGLAIEGLVRHHKIDPLDYNRVVDDSLPLESILSPDPDLRALLEDIDKSKVKLWLFTNAYINHGKRVVRLLGVEDQFEGLTFCDYAAQPMLCKPHPDMFAKAMREAGVSDIRKCYFVGRYSLLAAVTIYKLNALDDSGLNCKKAEEIGWTVAHLVENTEPVPAKQVCKYQIQRLQELRKLFPQFFKSTANS